MFPTPIQSASAPVRSARSRTCDADSSPETYSVRSPERAHLAATSSSSVDLPTPGSPASSTTAPGTTPSPSTRSSSAMEVFRRRALSVGTSPMGTVLSSGTDDDTARAGAPPRSATVPQAWHSPQRPTQRVLVHPHSVQA